MRGHICTQTEHGIERLHETILSSVRSKIKDSQVFIGVFMKLPCKINFKGTFNLFCLGVCLDTVYY